MKKYLRTFTYSLRSTTAYLPSFAMRNIFFLVILFVFYSLWKAIFAAKPGFSELTLTQILWYLTFTETIELSKSRVMWEVQQEVKDGTLAYTLQRPYSYPLYQLARSAGESMIKIIPILCMGFVVAVIAVGPLPGYLSALPFGLILITGGIVLSALWYIAIGLLAFWTEEVSPFYIIYQKLVFILGGMFFPIDLFPPWLRNISRSLPFAYSAYWPAYTMVSFSTETFLKAFAGQLVWITVIAVFVTGLFRAGSSRVQVQGG